MFLITFFVRRGERERERDIDVREKHRLFASCEHPDQGLNPQTFSAWDDSPTN